MVKVKVARKGFSGGKIRGLNFTESRDLTIDSVLITHGPNRDELMRIFQCQYDDVSVFAQPFRGSAELSNGAKVEVVFNLSSISYLSHSDKSGYCFQFQAEVHSMNVVGATNSNLIASGSVFSAGFVYDTRTRNGKTLTIT